MSAGLTQPYDKAVSVNRGSFATADMAGTGGQGNINGPEAVFVKHSQTLGLQALGYTKTLVF